MRAPPLAGEIVRPPLLEAKNLQRARQLADAGRPRGRILFQAAQDDPLEAVRDGLQRSPEPSLPRRICNIRILSADSPSVAPRAACQAAMWHFGPHASDTSSDKRLNRIMKLPLLALLASLLLSTGGSLAAQEGGDVETSRPGLVPFG